MLYQIKPHNRQVSRLKNSARTRKTSKVVRALLPKRPEVLCNAIIPPTSLGNGLMICEGCACIGKGLD